MAYQIQSKSLSVLLQQMFAKINQKKLKSLIFRQVNKQKPYFHKQKFTTNCHETLLTINYSNTVQNPEKSVISLEKRKHKPTLPQNNRPMLTFYKEKSELKKKIPLLRYNILEKNNIPARSLQNNNNKIYNPNLSSENRVFKKLTKNFNTVETIHQIKKTPERSIAQRSQQGLPKVKAPNLQHIKSRINQQEPRVIYNRQIPAFKMKTLETKIWILK